MANSGKKEIGLAIVGCGTIGRIRAIMARDYPGIGWLGLCDINTELGEKLRNLVNPYFKIVRRIDFV